MIKCYICKKEFENNLAGQFTSHLLKVHNILTKDYVVLTKYNNNFPKCACGHCEKEPEFYRGEFKKYAKGHNRLQWREKKYIEKNGKPVCKTCGKNVKFNRGVPNIYCSHKCQEGKWNQKKVADTVFRKYAVKSVFQLEEVKRKIVDTNLKKYGKKYFLHSDGFKNEIRKKLKESWKKDKEKRIIKVKKTKIERYGRFNNIEKMKETCERNFGLDHPSKKEENRKSARQRMRVNNPMFNKETVKKCCDTLSKMEINYFRKRKFKETDLSYQSTYEYNFLEHCQKNNVLHEIAKGKVFKYKRITNGKHYYISDYVFKNEFIIEIKSTWIKEKQGGDKVISSKKRLCNRYGYKFVLILDNNFYKFDKMI